MDKKQNDNPKQPSQDNVKLFCDGIPVTAKVTEDGFIRGEAIFTRTGIFPYRGTDGKMVNVYRPKEEVFAKDHIESAKLMPFVNDHPAEKRLDIKNADGQVIGATGENLTVKDDKYLIGSFLITDKKAIQEVKDGTKDELSMGYSAFFCDEQGDIEGVQYDYIQRNLHANHLALVKRGRANTNFSGDQAKINLLDSFDFIMHNKSGFDLFLDKKGTKMLKIVLDGIEYEASPEVGNALTKAQKETTDLKQQVADADIAYKQLKADFEKLSGEKDVIADEIKQVKTDMVDHKKIDEMVKIRASIVDNAQKAFDKEEMAKIADSSNLDIKKAIVNKMRPNIVLDGKENIYIEAVYDAVIDNIEKDTDYSGSSTNDNAVGNTDVIDLDDIRKKAHAENRDVWMKTLEGGK